MPIAKVWNGSAWVTPFFKYPSVWTGSEWVTIRPRIYNGSTWGGAATQTVTVTVGAYVFSQQYVGTAYYYGLISNNESGSISPQYAYIVDSSPKFIDLYWYQFSSINGTTTYTVRLSVLGEDVLTAIDIGPWSNMNINGTNYAKSNATTSVSGNRVTLEWVADANNPFGTTEGVNRTVTFS